jgi:predicted flavoprotein YhiN
LKNDYKALIVGGGASGLMCAIELLRAKNSLSGSQILILEKKIFHTKNF